MALQATTPHRDAAPLLKVAGTVAVLALTVAGVSAGTADAAPSSTALLNLRLAGSQASELPVTVRAVRDDETLGTRQVTLTVGTASTDRRGVALVHADQAALRAFTDGAGLVNFESEVIVDGAPVFTSFSRRWTGTGWADRDGVPAAASVVVNATPVPAPANSGTGAAAKTKMTNVTVAPAAARSEVPCYWYDDSAGDAWTKIGEFHTGTDAKGHFDYGKTSDSDISVGYNYGAGWTLGGSGHVSNTTKVEIRFNQGQRFHHQVQTSFQYIHWHLTLGASCAAPKRWGNRYYKVTPSSWQLGSRIGAKVGGKFCTSSSGRREYAPNGTFTREKNRAYTYTAAANAFGAGLSATSGLSENVDTHYHFGRNKKVRHYLCGTPNVAVSKIVYAR
jgi:hypothetical protein